MLLCVESNVKTLFLGFLALISSICCIVIIAYGSIKTYQIKAFSKTFKTVYYINNLFWLCSIIGYTLDSLLPLTTSCLEVLGIIAQLAFYGYGAGFCTLYLLFVIRLNELFRNTQYKLSIYSLILLCSAALSMLILQILTGYHYTIYQWEIAYITGTIWIFINLFYCISIGIIFLLKTIKLYKSIQSIAIDNKCTDNNNNNNNINNNDDIDTLFNHPTLTTITTDETSTEMTSITLTKTAKTAKNILKNNRNCDDMMDNLLFEAIKCLICVLFAVITTTGVDFMSIYRGFIAKQDTVELIHLHLTLNAYDSFINILCLHLQFTYFDTFYHTLCCPINYVIGSCIMIKDKNHGFGDKKNKSIKIANKQKLPKLVTSITTHSNTTKTH